MVGWNEGNRVTRGPSVKDTCHCTFLNFETCFNLKKKKDKNEQARFAYEGCGSQPLRQLPIKSSPPFGIPILPHCTMVGLCKQKNMPLLRLGYRKYCNLSLGLSLLDHHTPWTEEASWLISPRASPAKGLTWWGTAATCQQPHEWTSWEVNPLMQQVFRGWQPWPTFWLHSLMRNSKLEQCS